ncbi:MAG: pyridoxamine 5'-phosphate oxidase family protein [Nitrospiraceae bacterium]|nr:pyridoxamine 5'-phosphate oxidase family protein [Nitrospiraceae bacterium]
MRKWKKEIKDKAVIIDLLNTCHVGRLGTIGKDGYPMVKPLNFAYNPLSPPFSKGGREGIWKDLLPYCKGRREDRGHQKG